MTENGFFFKKGAEVSPMTGSAKKKKKGAKAKEGGVVKSEILDKLKAEAVRLNT